MRLAGESAGNVHPGPELADHASRSLARSGASSSAPGGAFISPKSMTGPPTSPIIPNIS